MRKLFSLLAMMVVTITAMAQTGTLQNADFSEGLVADASISSDGMKEVPSWRINSANGQYRAGAVVAYGSTTFVGNAAPAAGPEGSNGQGLAVLGAWTNTTQYVQDVTLAAGKYNMKVPVYNAAGTSNFVKNLIGVKYGETEKYATALSYPVGAWTVEAVEFELTEETVVTVSLGYEGGNVGNSPSQHLFIDCVKLEAPAAGPEVTVNPSFFSGEEEIALSAESAVSVESASAIKVGFGEGADAVKYATYTINEVVDAEGDGAPMDITKPLITKATQFHSPMTTDDEQTDGDIEAVYPFLLDGDLETYWHSRWEDGSQPMGTHYLQVSDIDEESIVLVMSRRYWQTDQVTSMSVWGYDSADDAIAKEQGVKLAEIELPFGASGETLTSAPFLTQGKSVLRFYAETTYGTGTSCNRGYWHCSEFQLYPATDGDGNQTQKTPIAAGQLNLNGFGYAEFEEELMFKLGTKYNVEIKAWDTEDIYTPELTIKDPVATFTCDFIGAYEAPAEGPVVAIEEGEGTYTVTSTSADAALYYICKPYSYLGEGKTPESVLQEDIEAMSAMIASEEEWELYDHMGLLPAPKTFTIADYAERFSGEECFLIAANVGWDGEKIAVISNVEKVNFTIATPKVEAGTITATYLPSVPAIDIVFEDHKDVTPSFKVDILLDGEKLNCEYGQEWNEIYGYPSEALADGEHTIVFPAGSILIDSTVENAEEWSVTFTVGESKDDLDFTDKVVKEVKTNTSTIEEGKWYTWSNPRNVNAPYGAPTPFYDQGEGKKPKREAFGQTVRTVLSKNTPAPDVTKYLVRFTQSGTGEAYHIQFATGNYLKNDLTTTATAEDAGLFMVYAATNSKSADAGEPYTDEGVGINITEDGETYGKRLDGNGANAELVTWNSGKIETADANNVWFFEEVEMGEAVNETYTVHITGAPSETKVTFGEQEYGDGETFDAKGFSLSQLTVPDHENYVKSVELDGTDINVTYTYAKKVADLSDLNNDHAYVLICERGQLTTNEGQFAPTATKSYTESKSFFALVNYGDNFYLWSVAEEGFVFGDKSIAAEGEFQNVVLNAQEDGTFVLYLADTDHYINIDGATNLLIDNWDTADAGNKYTIYEVESFDATTALALLESFTTGITTNTAAPAAPAAIYNVQGQRIMKFQKGINIAGGKKVIK